MACPTSKAIAGKSWPLFRETSDKLCAYKIEGSSQTAIATVVAAAKGMKGYAKRSQFFVTPKGVRVYVYFNQT